MHERHHRYPSSGCRPLKDVYNLGDTCSVAKSNVATTPFSTPPSRKRKDCRDTTCTYIRRDDHPRPRVLVQHQLQPPTVVAAAVVVATTVVARGGRMGRKGRGRRRWTGCRLRWCCGVSRGWPKRRGARGGGGSKEGGGPGVAGW